MTSKLTITKEQVIALIAEHSYDSALVDALEYLVAAMDSEPVVEVLSSRPGNDTSTIDRALPVGTQLYRHAQVSPDREPYGFTDGDRRGMIYEPQYADRLNNPLPVYRHAQPALEGYSDFEEFWSSYTHPLAQDDELKGFAWDIWNVRGSNSQQAPVAQNEVTAEDCPAFVRYDVTEVDEAWACGFNACRAAMLQAGNSPVIPDTWIPVSERMPEREYVLAADFSGKHYSPCQPNTQVGIFADWFDDGNPTWDDGDGNDLHLKQVTHWMPLQPPRRR